jgi:hypothetical protein
LALTSKAKWRSQWDISHPFFINFADNFCNIFDRDEFHLRQLHLSYCHAPSNSEHMPLLEPSDKWRACYENRQCYEQLDKTLERRARNTCFLGCFHCSKSSLLSCRVCSYLLTLVPRRRIFLPWRWRRYDPPKRRFTQYLHGATSQKTAFFIVTAVKTSNLT